MVTAVLVDSGAILEGASVTIEDAGATLLTTGGGMMYAGMLYVGSTGISELEDVEELIALLGDIEDTGTELEALTEVDADSLTVLDEAEVPTGVELETLPDALLVVGPDSDPLLVVLGLFTGYVLAEIDGIADVVLLAVDEVL